MSKKTRQRRRDERTRRTRARRTRVAGLSAAAVIVVAAGVLAVQASSGGGSGLRVHLYQGQAVFGRPTVTLADVVGKGEPAIVNFWASNCPPCRLEMPGFQKVYDQEGGRGYVMLGVDVGPQTGLGTHRGAQALIRAEDIRYPVGYAEGDGVMAHFALRGMPTTLFFDASGHQVGRVVGYLDEASLRQRLSRLLAQAQ